MRSLNRTFVLAPLLVLAGCTTGAVHDEPDAYHAAYDDGCYSAKVLDGATGLAPLANRDETRYRADDAYRRGWELGFNDCRDTVGNRG